MKFKKSFLVLFALFILLGNSLALAVSDTPAQTSGEPTVTPSGEVSGETPVVSGETPAASGETPTTSGELAPVPSGEESGEEYGKTLASVAVNSKFAIEKNTTLKGAMEASVSGDETFIFAIVTAPSHGTAVQTKSGDAEFTYTPAKDYTGDDSFTFRLESGDVYSNIGTITITVKAPSEPVIPFNYTDMQDHWANYSASHLAARGLIIGEEIGGKYYFNPERKMTRSEFVLFLLAIVDPDNTAKEADIKFADAGEMPAWLVKKAKQAYELGITKGAGSGKDIYFYPDRTITRSEAFVMINNVLAKQATLSNASSGDLAYKDAKTIPDWALQAIRNLSGYKIVQGDANKNVNPNGTVTRAEAAELSFKLLKELEEQAMNPSGDTTKPSGEVSGDKSGDNSGDLK